MEAVKSVFKDDSTKERMYVATLSTGEQKKYPAYSVIKKIIVSQGLIRWLKKSNANNRTQEEIYQIIQDNKEQGASAIANAVWTSIFTGTGEDYADDQRNIGSHIHWLIEQHLSGHDVGKVEEPFTYAWGQFLEWQKLHTIEVLPEGLELELVSLTHRFGGTIDCVATIDGQLEIVDWKTSSGIFNDYPVQVAAYRALWNSNMPDRPINSARIIRIPKKEWNVYKDKRSRNKLLECKLDAKKLDYLFGLFTKARDWYEYMSATSTLNKINEFLDTV